ncbi:MAG: flagellar filament capping protein FliD [Steroidobacteraceae bacterium]|jgi:flagellar hook-associated protein 2|nr:flagellar filament capping protein FliD [Steroidobacteraceae bacterium]
MGTITSNGVGSGIDIDGLVGRLVQAEGSARQARLAREETRFQAQLSAFGAFRSAVDQFRGALTSLRDGAVFQSRSTAVGDSTLLTASAGQSAVAGSYEVEVVRLATGPRLAAAPVPSADSVIGTGTLTIAAGPNSFTVEVTSADRTLAGIRDAINARAGGSGVSASIVTANDGARLVLNGARTGVANAIRVTQAGGDGGLAALVYDPPGGATNLTVLRSAQDAQVRIDGFAYDSPTNSVSGAITGVTLNLAKSSPPGTTTSVGITVDQSAPARAIDTFVSAYNRVLTTLRPLGDYNVETRQGGVLLGDTTLRSFLTTARGVLGATLPQGTGSASVRSISDIGITTNVDGTLKVDSAKLNSKLAADPAAVSALFGAGSTGIARRLDALVDGVSRNGGAIDARTSGLRRSIEDVTRQREALNDRLQALERRLRQQFTAMDSLVSQLRQTGSNLNAALGQLPTR